MTPIPPSPPVARSLPELPPLPPARNVNCGVDLFIGLDIHEYAKAYALAAISAHEAEVGRLRNALEGVQRTLAQANNTENGPIVDTIWHDTAETLFDYIDAALTKGETK